MLKTGACVFVQIPNEFNQRTLNRGTIRDVLAPEGYGVEFEDDLPLEKDLDVLLWYELGREFVQHCARVDEVAGRSPLRVALTTMGDSISGERRRHFRVSTTAAGVTAWLEDERGCTVLDVSAAGLAVVSSQSHPVGVTLPAALQFRGENFEGRVCVQNSREWGQGRTRYGLRGISVSTGRDELMTSLTQISLAVQSEQLVGPR